MANAVVTKEEKKEVSTAAREETPAFFSLQQEMNRLFDEFRHTIGFSRPSRWLDTFTEHHAKVDVKETDKDIVVTAEVPGVEMKDIDITLTSNGLVIKGEKKMEKEENEKGYYKMERTYGSFFRLVPLPCEVQKEHLTATYKHGIVKITMPKALECGKSEHKIEVKAG